MEDYPADPHVSRLRGSNENHSGFLRQYIREKRQLSTVTDQELKTIEDSLKHLRRKSLGLKTPL
jgi:IS30 family transposase